LNNYDLGVTISLLGVGITFLVLGVLILLIYGIQKFFPHRAISVGGKNGDELIPIEKKIAIAAAWWYLHKNEAPELGKILERPPRNWWNQTR
jgi:Na+-transporting methylmalonyl-CoA/oxaloacetate decarboxylase gamma subunit